MNHSTEENMDLSGAVITSLLCCDGFKWLMWNILSRSVIPNLALELQECSSTTASSWLRPELHWNLSSSRQNQIRKVQIHAAIIFFFEYKYIDTKRNYDNINITLSNCSWSIKGINWKKLKSNHHTVESKIYRHQLDNISSDSIWGSPTATTSVFKVLLMRVKSSQEDYPSLPVKPLASCENSTKVSHAQLSITISYWELLRASHPESEKALLGLSQMERKGIAKEKINK